MKLEHFAPWLPDALFGFRAFTTRHRFGVTQCVVVNRGSLLSHFFPTNDWLTGRALQGTIGPARDSIPVCLSHITYTYSVAETGSHGHIWPCLAPLMIHWRIYKITQQSGSTRAKAS